MTSIPSAFPPLQAAAELTSQTMVERAKSVIIVAERVDDAEAAQILTDAADRAGVPVSTAAIQVMATLQVDAAEGVVQDASVHRTVVRALGVVHVDPTDAP